MRMFCGAYFFLVGEYAWKFDEYIRSFTVAIVSVDHHFVCMLCCFFFALYRSDGTRIYMYVICYLRHPRLHLLPLRQLRLHPRGLRSSQSVRHLDSIRTNMTFT